MNPAKLLPDNSIKLKVGDAVRVVVPKFVLRVGYPKDLKHYIAEAERLAGADVAALIQKLVPESQFVHGTDWKEQRVKERTLSNLGWLMAHADQWGGRERTIHFIERPDLKDADGWVCGLRRVVTGTYSPGYRSGGYEYEEWNPPFLDNAKTHRIAKLVGGLFKGFEGDVELPVAFLEKTA